MKGLNPSAWSPEKVAKIGQSRQGPSQRPVLSWLNLYALLTSAMIGQGGKDTTKTIVRADLVGVTQAFPGKYEI